MHEYNTRRPDVILREYGRNIQKLVQYVMSTKDRQKRTELAHTLIELMKQVNTKLKEGSEYNQKLWDDLYIMSNFTLDVDSPFPMPEKESLGKKPQRVAYNQNRIRYKHYGKNIELLIDKASQLETEEEREASIGAIGKLMKSFYSSWNREVVDDEVILGNMKELSKGKIVSNVQEVKEKNLLGSNKERNRGPRTQKPSNTNRSNQVNKRRRD